MPSIGHSEDTARWVQAWEITPEESAHTAHKLAETVRVLGAVCGGIAGLVALFCLYGLFEGRSAEAFQYGVGMLTAGGLGAMAMFSRSCVAAIIDHTAITALYTIKTHNLMVADRQQRTSGIPQAPFPASLLSGYQAAAPQTAQPRRSGVHHGETSDLQRRELAKKLAANALQSR